MLLNTANGNNYEQIMGLYRLCLFLISREIVLFVFWLAENMFVGASAILQAH